MKIRSLHFKNINSLYGEWKIDFDDNTYKQNSLFVLTGPTGAGKSTVLDAICLALYGQTPRMGKITKSSNELMSKNTSECFAEIIFTVNNIDYISRFEQRRAKNSADGALQEAKHFIYEKATKKILSEKRNESSNKIVEITGMDFSRFTRSILLAQGAFDSFLKANTEVKSELLEQITGTEIYSVISTEVYNTYKEKKQKKEETEAIIKAILTLSPEEEQELQQTQKRLTEKKSDFEKEISSLTKAKQWSENLIKISQDLEKNTEKKQSLQKAKEEQKDNYLKLENAQKADILRAEYEVLQAKEKDLQNELTYKKSLENDIPKAEQNRTQKNAEYISIKTALQNKKQEYNEIKPKIEKTKLLDISLQAENSILLSHTEIKNTKEKDLAHNERLYKTESDNAKNIEQEIIKHNKWKEENKTLSTIKEELSRITQTIDILQNIIEQGTAKKREIQNKEIEKKNHEKELLTLEHNEKTLLLEQKENIIQQEKTKKAIQHALNNELLRELETTLKFLINEKNLVERILSLEEQRKLLQDNSPCPLCGAMEHPFAEGNIPNNTERDKEIKSLEQRIEIVKNNETNLAKLLVEAEKINASLQIEQNKKNFTTQKIQEIIINLSNLEKERRELLDTYTAKHETLKSELLTYGIQQNEYTLNTIISVLQNKISQWNTVEKQLQEFTEKSNNSQKSLAVLTNTINTLQTALAEVTKQIHEQNNKISNIKKERQQIFGEKNPTETENNYIQELETIEQNLEKVAKQKEEEQTKLTILHESLKEQNKKLITLQAEIADKNTAFSKKLEESGFISIEAYKNSLLPQEEKEMLKNQLSKLDNDILLCMEQEKTLLNQEKIEREKNITDKSIQELTETIHKQEEDKNTLLQELGILEERLRQNANTKQNHKALSETLNTQRADLENWELLNKLIGSADGKKFRTFAQGITFERVIQFANQKLQQLQKRYLLIRDDIEPLSLNVYDDYQGGEIRSVQTLSGGESFIVSLSLALGLAQMASNTISVDSLFLDEGFGTLDEESLEMALATLASIQQEGKLIGIISHIPLLKERITTQISIIPQSGGKSIIEGAGCYKL